MRRWIHATLVATSIAGLFGCTQRPPTAATVVEDKVYTVSPNALAVKAGIITGELTGLKVTESIEQGSGKVAVPATLSGNLRLRNTSPDQTVRLLAVNILYIDADGQLIPLEEARPAAAVRFGSARTDRLDPGQDTSEQVSVAFPADALQSKRLKDIRIDLTYLPAAFRQHVVNLPVVIGSQ